MMPPDIECCWAVQVQDRKGTCTICACGWCVVVHRAFSVPFLKPVPKIEISRFDYAILIGLV